MAFLRDLNEQMMVVQERVARVEKRHKSRDAKRNSRKGSKTLQVETHKGHSKKLVDDFDDVATDQMNPNFHEGLEWEEDFENTGKKDISHHEAASSEGRPISVFDRIGKKMTEHDLRLKLEKLTAEKKDK